MQEFQRLKIKIATIKNVQSIKKSDKLYKITLDLGAEIRQVVAGLVPYYSPLELTGKRVVVLTNIEPVTLFGHASNGMILCSRQGERVSLLEPDSDIGNGAVVV